jgi:hypothetical protein
MGSAMERYKVTSLVNWVRGNIEVNELPVKSLQQIPELATEETDVHENKKKI